MSRKMFSLALAIALLSSCSSHSPQRVQFDRKEGAALPGTGEDKTKTGQAGEANASGFTLVKQGAIHRLNNREYNFTVRDLLGTSLRPADSFPEDPVGANFDNEGDALSISPTLAKYYYTSAANLADEAAKKDPATFTKCKALTETACLQSWIASFGLKAWRRPLTEDEKKTVYDNAMKATTPSTAPLADFIRQTVMQFLVSPYFTFRIELDDKPESTATRRLTAYELASRLSYFIWSSMPSDKLFALAADGTLLNDDVLSAQVKDMIADQKAIALTEGFGNIWLGVKKAKRVTLSPTEFPKFTPAIRDAMVKETQLLFNEYLTKDLDVNTMLSAPFTFVNDELAAYYGLPLPKSTTPVRVELPAGPRRGVLSHGSILSSTSTEVRTSIVRRGVFILANILCIEPPDLPPGTTIDPLPAVPDPKKTTREILSVHIANPKCAGCHAIIDPPGFAMEGFGPDGLFRTVERGNIVDSSGSFAGKAFKDASEFNTIVQSGGQFQKCVAKKVFGYAMGRASESEDDATLEAIMAASKTSGGTLRSIIEHTALSEAFRSR